MLASKPVITCTDSGGPLEFVIPGQTGLECDPEPAALARAMDSLYEDRTRATAMGAAARDHYESLKISWSNVVEKLVS
jgi:glycosyltransferase involved in cell wall biosynthesis